MKTIVQAILVDVPAVRIKAVPAKQIIYSYIDIILDNKSQIPYLQGCRG